MRSRWLLLPALLLIIALTPVAPQALAQRTPQTRVEQRRLTTVVDWQSGTTKGLLISNNDGGELRLALDSYQGTFESAPFEASFASDAAGSVNPLVAANAVGATWRADIPQGTTLTVEVRGTNDDPRSGNASWGAYQALASGDARSQADDGAYASADTLAFPASTRYLQIRVSFASTVAQASAILSELNIAYLSSTDGPLYSPGLPRTPILSGAATLTRRPTLIARSVWGGTAPVATLDRTTPRGVIIHQIASAPDASDPLVLLRALAAYQTSVLGWDDMPYHYVIDDSGTLYEGRAGGPTSSVARLAGGDNAIHIALIGSPDAPASDAAQATLTGLLAWLSEAYNIPTTGDHTISSGNSVSQRPNLAAHSEVVPGAVDPGQPVRDLVTQLRTRADQSVVRARWYFPEGNVQDYAERLALFNPTSSDASATVSLLQPDVAPTTRILDLPAGGRVDLPINGVVTDTNDLSAVVESNASIIVERSMTNGGGTDLDSGPGIEQLSRVWYFAEGSTADTFRTYLVLLNPQTVPVNATITYMKGDGTTATQQVSVPAQQRTVVSVADTLPGAGFGTQVISSLPLAVERTMRFGDGGAGLHIARGITSLARTWYFAEGTTASPYQMRLLVLNPNEQLTNTTVTFRTPDGTPLVRRYAIPPRTRLAIDVNEVVPDLGVSTSVEADRLVAVERALYFNDGKAGTVTAGATAPAYTWRFADGRTDDSQEFLLLSNQGRNPARVTVDVVLANGSQASTTVQVPGDARYTVALHELYPGQAQIAATVRSTQPLVAERSIFPGGGARGGTTSLGVPGNTQ